MPWILYIELRLSGRPPPNQQTIQGRSGTLNTAFETSCTIHMCYLGDTFMPFFRHVEYIFRSLNILVLTIFLGIGNGKSIEIPRIRVSFT